MFVWGVCDTASHVVADLPQIRAGYVIIFPSNEGETAGSESTIKVLGEVQTPGNVEYLEDQTLIDVLLQTGGVTRDASVDRIRVLSGGKPVYVNLQEYLDTGDTTLLPSLKPGATIFVPRAVEGQNGKSGQTVFVMGEVIKPGGYETQSEIGFIDIVASAGGPSAVAPCSPCSHPPCLTGAIAHKLWRGTFLWGGNTSPT